MIVYINTITIPLFLEFSNLATILLSYMVKIMFISILMKNLKKIENNFWGGVDISIGDVETAIQDEF